MKKLLYLLLFIGFILESFAQISNPTTNFNFGTPGVSYFQNLLAGAVLESSNQVLLAYRNRGLVSVNLTNTALFDTVSFTNTLAGSNNIVAMCKQSNDVWLAFDNGWLAKKLSFGYQYVNLNLLYSGIKMNKITNYNGNLAIASDQGLFIYNGTILTRYFSGNASILNDTITNCDAFGGSLTFTTKGGELGKLSNNQISGFSGLPAIRNAILGYNGEIYAVSPVIDSIVKIDANGAITYIPGFYTIFRANFAEILVRNLQDTSILIYQPGQGTSLCRIKNNEVYMANGFHGGVLIWGLLTESSQLLFIRAQKSTGSAGYFLDFDKFRAYAVSNENIKKLDINQVSALFNQDGDFFMYNISPFVGGYVVPKNDTKSSIFAKSFWIGGKDQNNQLRISSQTYRQASTLGFNFISGLIHQNGVADSTTAPQFNRIWEVTKSQIQDFQIAFAAGNVTNGSFQIPRDILQWPGNRPNSTEKLAPYVDVNNDNLYNPYHGDYPLIKGDKMLWWIYNDLRPNRALGISTALGVEIKASAYAYACSNLTGADTVLNYSTFLNLDIQNRSSNTYTETYIGNFVDVDLGNFSSDYVGCFVDKSTWYTSNDYLIFPGNPPTIRPAIGFTLLSGPLADLNDGIDNNRNGIVDEPNEEIAMSGHMYFNNDGSVIGNPVTGSDAYNYLNSKWRDDVPLTYGSNGYGNSIQINTCSNNLPAKFMFPGTTDSIGYGVGGSPSNPITLFPWTEYNPCDTGSFANAPGIRRNLASFGPFTLQPNQTKNLEMAIIYSNGSGQLGSVNQLYNHDIDRIRFWYNNMQFPSCGFPLSTQTLQPKSEINFFPNPNNTGLLNYQMKDASRNSYQIFNITGKRIASGTLFESQGILDLSNLANGMYFIQIVDGKTYKIVLNR